MKYLHLFCILTILSICLNQLTPPELYQVNLSQFNLSSSTIASANVSIYTGYTALQAGSSGTPPKRQIGFTYVQSNGNNNNVAIIPIGGLGPGYSTLEVLLNEFGPFIFTDDIQTDEQLQSKPYGLNLNPYALSYQSNLLFIDAIPQVGMSYWSGSTQGNPSNNNDQQQASDIYSVVTDIVTSTGYQSLKNATFHIIGSGYTAKLAPLIAQAFARDTKLNLNLVGMFIGNPLFQSYNDQTMIGNQRLQNMISYLNNHNIIGDAEYLALQTCYKNQQDPVCQWAEYTLYEQTKNLNPQDIFRYCYSDNFIPQMYNCTANFGLKSLLSDPSIQQALHFIQTPQYTNIFNYNILSNYNYDFSNSTLQAFQNLINSKKYKIWFYSADASIYMNQYDTIYYLEKVLGLQITEEAALFQISVPKPIGNQVGGFTTSYNNGVMFGILKKAGFLAGKWEGQELSVLFSMYLAKAQPSE